MTLAAQTPSWSASERLQNGDNYIRLADSEKAHTNNDSAIKYYSSALQEYYNVALRYPSYEPTQVYERLTYCMGALSNLGKTVKIDLSTLGNVRTSTTNNGEAIVSKETVQGMTQTVSIESPTKDNAISSAFVGEPTISEVLAMPNNFASRVLTATNVTIQLSPNIGKMIRMTSATFSMGEPSIFTANSYTTVQATSSEGRRFSLIVDLRDKELGAKVATLSTGTKETVSIKCTINTSEREGNLVLIDIWR